MRKQKTPKPAPQKRKSQSSSIGNASTSIDSVLSQTGDTDVEFNKTPVSRKKKTADPSQLTDSQTQSSQEPATPKKQSSQEQPTPKKSDATPKNKEKEASEEQKKSSEAQEESAKKQSSQEQDTPKKTDSTPKNKKSKESSQEKSEAQEEPASTKKKTPKPSSSVDKIKKPSKTSRKRKSEFTIGKEQVVLTNVEGVDVTRDDVEVNLLQRTDLNIPRAAFLRLLKEVIREISPSIKISKGAFDTIQTYVEHTITDVFSIANFITKVNKTRTVNVPNLLLASAIKGLNGEPLNMNNSNLKDILKKANLTTGKQTLNMDTVCEAGEIIINTADEKKKKEKNLDEAGRKRLREQKEDSLSEAFLSKRAKLDKSDPTFKANFKSSHKEPKEKKQKKKASKEKQSKEKGAQKDKDEEISDSEPEQ
ncbi:hypothetical protein AKO1_002672 [Acrasis kona]|uniref:Core Histone H2A/H2B/H3 domain-containing protein n=1 Tax=Acrasis kona TaxID=1008807 RepID=A0AAW2ZQN8_9EUKA